VTPHCGQEQKSHSHCGNEARPPRHSPLSGRARMEHGKHLSWQSALLHQLDHPASSETRNDCFAFSLFRGFVFEFLDSPVSSSEDHENPKVRKIEIAADCIRT